MYDPDPVKVPKNNLRTLLTLATALLALAAMVLIVSALADAGTVEPGETKAPAAPIGAPDTLPR